ncbi:MAG: hypothetical protein ACKVOG_07735 [Rhodoglobus sp.]
MARDHLARDHVPAHPARVLRTEAAPYIPTAIIALSITAVAIILTAFGLRRARA